MLSIIWGRENLKELVPRFVLDSRVYFRQNKKPEWFENDFVKRVLKTVDGSTVLFEEALKDKHGHGISSDVISTGCKTLCCIYYDTEDHIFFGGQMGDNCLPFLSEIARERNLTIMLEHYADFPSYAFDEKLLKYGDEILTQETYDDYFCAWSATTLEDDYLERVYNSGV